MTILGLILGSYKKCETRISNLVTLGFPTQWLVLVYITSEVGYNICNNSDKNSITSVSFNKIYTNINIVGTDNKLHIIYNIIYLVLSGIKYVLYI